MSMIEPECDCDWPQGDGLSVFPELLPDAHKYYIALAVGQRIDGRWYLGNDQLGADDKYLTEGKPQYELWDYLEKIGRHLAAVVADFKAGTKPTEDHLAAIACDAILAMQHEERNRAAAKKKEITDTTP